MAHLASESSHNIPVSGSQPPNIDAAFLVKFDNRKGYTVTWHKSIDNVKVEGEVEYKALPSGLHNVEEDLVYFLLENHVGISAFLRKASDQNERNARMLAVGALIPLEYGRMGKSWLHAEKLRDLARIQIENPDDYSSLDKYWEENRVQHDQDLGSTADEQPNNNQPKPRALSVGSIAIPAHILTPHHPALALTNLLDTFGPLIFPLFRAGLQRKRILLVGEAPVELTCDFVYNISVLSSLSKSVASFLPIDETSNLRLQALFNVGVADVITLTDLKSPWIACTTDDVLCTKPKLFDLLVILPTAAARKGSKKVYPKLIQSTPDLATNYPKQGQRATQRDARRYMTLRKGLHSLPSSLRQSPIEEQTSNEDDSKSTSSSISTIPDKDEAVEPLSWSLMAYTSLVWWASAGDRRSGLMEAEEIENEQDIALLRDVVGSGNDDSITKEIAIVAYFHGWSSLIFSAMNQAVQRVGERYRDENEEEDNNSDEDEDRTAITNNDNQTGIQESEEGRELLERTIEDEDEIEINEDDVRLMGLDIWSDTDRNFIEEMVEYWWCRRAIVRGGTVECCGMRMI